MKNSKVQKTQKKEQIEKKNNLNWIEFLNDICKLLMNDVDDDNNEDDWLM